MIMQMLNRYFLLSGCGEMNVCRGTGFFCWPKGLCLPVSGRETLNHQMSGYLFLLQSGSEKAHLTIMHI